MRQIFEAELKQVGDDLAEMSRLVEQAIVKAGMALLTADIELAQQVVAQDQAIDELERDLDERCVLLLAQQQPVATDLRVVVSALRISSSLERMGDLARHIAQVARGRYPRHAVSGDLEATFAQMNDAAVRVERRVTTLLTTRDLTVAHNIERDDDLLDTLNQLVARQQEQIELLLREVSRLRQRGEPEGTAAARDPRDELPPHY